MVHERKQKFVKEFEENIEMAELRALSKISLERPLTEKEYKKFIKLGKKFMKK